MVNHQFCVTFLQSSWSRAGTVVSIAALGGNGSVKIISLLFFANILMSLEVAHEPRFGCALTHKQQAFGLAKLMSTSHSLIKELDSSLGLTTNTSGCTWCMR